MSANPVELAPTPLGERNQREGFAFSQLKGVLDTLSARERLSMLKALAGVYGHRVLPGLGGGSAATTVSVAMGPKGPARPKSLKPAAEQQVNKKISLLNKEIKSTSNKVGKRLEDEHPLLLERERLFRELESLRRQNDVKQNSLPEGEGPPVKPEA
jgi:hypothetical protein